MLLLLSQNADGTPAHFSYGSYLIFSSRTIFALLLSVRSSFRPFDCRIGLQVVNVAPAVQELNLCGQ